jgi:hypothetical protein
MHHNGILLCEVQEESSATRLSKFYKNKHIKSNKLESYQNNVRNLNTTLNNMELTDRELALRWWDRLTIKENFILVFTHHLQEKNLLSAYFGFG